MTVRELLDRERVPGRRRQMGGQVVVQPNDVELFAFTHGAGIVDRGCRHRGILFGATRDQVDRGRGRSAIVAQRDRVAARTMAYSRESLCVIVDLTLLDERVGNKTASRPLSYRLPAP